MNLKDNLISIYNALSNISIKGSDAFTMAGIMNTISKLIDSIKNEDTRGE